MSGTSFGTKFILVNKVQQLMDPKVFTGGPWVHHATVARGFKEYVAFRHLETNALYIEEIDAATPTLFKKIEDDSEWLELARFLAAAGLLSMEGEIAAGAHGLPGFTKTEMP